MHLGESIQSPRLLFNDFESMLLKAFDFLLHGASKKIFGMVGIELVCPRYRLVTVTKTIYNFLDHGGRPN